MSERIYLVTEGVHDVTFLSRVLVCLFGFKQAQSTDELEEGWRVWLGNFGWPVKRKGKLQIGRLSVPAPELYVSSRATVAIANAEGIDAIGKKLTVDLESFAKERLEVDAVGVVLDADTGSGADVIRRFEKMAMRLHDLGLPQPSAVGAIAGRPRTGIFILPDGESCGTLEDVLLPLGRRVYPALLTAATSFVDDAMKDLDQLHRDERAEIEKPAGRKKATLSAAAALLKPGKAIQATLRDHRWISPETLDSSEMKPTVDFVRRLVSGSAPAGAPLDITEPLAG